VDNTAKLEFMRSQGADHVIDYTREDFTKNGVQYDFILDVIAYRSAFAYARALKPNGSYFVVGGSAGTLLQILFFGFWIKKITAKSLGILAVQPTPKDLTDVVEFFQTGKMKPYIEKRYPLSETADALRYLGAGQVKGKIIIEVQKDQS